MGGGGWGGRQEAVLPFKHQHTVSPNPNDTQLESNKYFRVSQDLFSLDFQLKRWTLAVPGTAVVVGTLVVAGGAEAVVW